MTEGKPMDRNAAAKGFAWTALFNLLAKIVFPLASIFLVSRRLGPSILGIAGLLQYTLAVAEVIRDAGISQSYLAEEKIDAETDASYGGLALITGLVPAVALLVLTPAMASFFRQSELLWATPWVSVCLVLNALATVPTSRILRKGDLKRQGMISLIAGAVSLVVTASLVALGAGFVSLVVQLVLNHVLSLAMVLRQEPLPGFRVGRNSLMAVFRRSRALLGANLINNLFLMSDIFVIQRMVGTTAGGLYNSAQNIAYKPADLISFPLSRTLMVVFSQAAGDHARLARAFYRSLAVIVLFVIPIYVFLGLGSDTLIRFLLGKDFLGSIPVLSALCLYLGFRTIGNISGNALVPLQRHSWTLYPWFLALAVTGAGLAWASRAPSLMNIVWAYVAGAVVVYGTIFGLALYFLPGTRELYGKVLRALATTGATSLVMLSCFHLPLPGWACFILAAAAGAAMHLSIIGWSYGTGTLGLLSKKGVRTVWDNL